MSEEQHVMLDHDAALAEYQRRKMLESMLGPIISLLFHALMMASLIFFYDAEAAVQTTSVELEMKELEVKELDAKTMEELETLEDIAQDMVPTVEKPTISIDESVDVSAVTDFSDAMASTDDGMDFSDVLNVRANDSPLKLSSLYGGRSNEGRQKTLARFGGSDVTEAAVLRALRWLKKTQNKDGSWAPSEKEAMAALGLLTFLAHGETPMSEEFGPTVQKAMQYLVGQVDKWPAKVSDRKWHSTFSYSNGIVAYALSEAYGLTKIPFVKPAMEKSLAYVVDGQLRNGGYSYGYDPSGKWDMSVAGWQYQAMKAGYVAGANVPGLEKAIDRGIGFMEKVSFSRVNNRFGYNVPGHGSDGLQGAGALCLQLLGSGDSYAAKAAIKHISDKCTVVWNKPGRKIEAASANPIYDWYYQTQVMFHAGRSTWKNWNDVCAPQIIRYQHQEGYWECPNPDRDKFKCSYDRWYTTTLAALSLQVYYRYLPTFKMPKSIAKADKTTMEKLDDDLGLEL
jgi:hypothetical protein